MTESDNPPKHPQAAELQPVLAPESLTDVLDKTEHVKNLVEQSASELSCINTSLKNEMGRDGTTARLEAALEQTQAVEEKVHDASDKLAVVTQALEAEVHQREALDQQLAVATEQSLAHRHAAMHDPLTGLANRSLFNDRLENGLAQAKRQGAPLTVMFLDLDGFKSVNDIHGHDTGDALLKTVADRLKENSRDADTVSRIGGDEFLYLVIGANDRQTITQLAQKIASCIRAPGQYVVGPLSVKASIGIARFPQDGQIAEDLIKNADAAMYQAKRERSEYAFAS